MKEITEKFTVKITDKGLEGWEISGGEKVFLHFTAGEALMLTENPNFFFKPLGFSGLLLNDSA